MKLVFNIFFLLITLLEDAVTVTASIETEPLPHNGDAADDHAIWVHPTDPELSTIIGTDKQGNLLVYDLSGIEIQSLPDVIYNVDILYDFPLAGNFVDLVT